MGWFDDLKGIGHTTLDVLGMVPVIGAVADLGNAAWYAAEEDYQNASLSLAAAVPGAGLTIGGLRIAKALKGAEAGMGAAKTSVKAAEKAYKPALKAQKKAGKAAGAARRGEAAAAESLKKAQAGTKAKTLWADPTAARVNKARQELADKKKVLQEARRQVRSGSLRRAAPALRQAEKAKDQAQAALKKAQEATKKGSGVTYRGRDFGRKKLRAADIGLGVAGIHYSEQAKGEAARAAAEAKAKAEAEGKSKKQQEEEARKAAQEVLDRKKGLLDKERTKKGARKQRKAARAQREREEQRERRDFKESQRRFDKRMQLKEARLGRKEDRKEAKVLSDKKALAGEISDLMENDPDYFKNNTQEKLELFDRATQLGVTADQFNNYINRNYESAKRIHRQNVYERESAEGRAWLNEKLDQPSLRQMGIPTPSARGRNIGRFKTGEVSPTKTEVRESVRESEEDERKKQRSRDRGRRQLEGRRDKKRGRGRDEERNPRRKLRSARR